MRFVLPLIILGACVISDDDDADPRCGDGFVDSGETCDDGNSIAGDGCTACRIDVVERMVNVSWQFRALATASDTSCPAGAENAIVSTIQVDASGAAVGQERTDPFPCSVGAGGIPFEVDELGGLVETRVRFEGPSGAYGASLPEIVDVSTRDADVPFVVFTDAGYVALEWSLSGVSCADDEIDDIEVTTTNAGKTYLDHFACEDVQGITGGVLAGTYSVEIRAMTGDSEVASAMVTGVTVDPHNQVTSLGVIDLVP
jgi:cysteine-rich repeat protein